MTRATHQAEELAAPLRELGAEVLLAPAIGIAPPSDPAPLREAAAQCDDYSWIIFTSVNAVEAFATELPLPRSCRARCAAIGAATREAAEKNGLSVSVVPAEYVAESLVEALGAENLKGQRVLIPSAAVTRDIVPGALRALGANVEVVEAYRNVIPPGAEVRAAEVFRKPWPDWVTFTSSSAVRNTVALAGVEAIAQMRIASIGRVTSHSIREHGLSIAAEAQQPGIEELAKAICDSH